MSRWFFQMLRAIYAHDLPESLPQAFQEHCRIRGTIGHRDDQLFRLIAEAGRPRPVALATEGSGRPGPGAGS